jgi:hypothetical protein
LIGAQHGDHEMGSLLAQGVAGQSAASNRETWAGARPQ